MPINGVHVSDCSVTERPTISLFEVNNERKLRFRFRLYCDRKDSAARRSCVTALYHATTVLKDAYAPIAPILEAELREACPILRDSYR